MGVEVIEKNSGIKLPNGFKGAVKIGFFDTAKYDNGVSVAEVAFYNEFGTISKKGNQHIPARPFMRNVSDDKAIMNKAFNIVKIELEKLTNGEAIAGIVGEWLMTEIKQSISKGEFKPNAPYTIKRKGSSRPLVDTGLLMSSVDFKVEK